MGMANIEKGVSIYFRGLLNLVDSFPQLYFCGRFLDKESNSIIQ